MLLGGTAWQSRERGKTGKLNPTRTANFFKFTRAEMYELCFVELIVAMAVVYFVFWIVRGE